jgi:hypothetical protein
VKIPRLIPPWLRRGVEAGVVGCLLAIGTLVAFQAQPARASVVRLPHGFDTSMILSAGRRGSGHP